MFQSWVQNYEIFCTYTSYVKYFFKNDRCIYQIYGYQKSICLEYQNAESGRNLTKIFKKCPLSFGKYAKKNL